MVLPCQLHVDEQLAARLRAFDGQLVLGPRTASKTRDFSLAHGAGATLLAELAGVRVLRVESLPPGVADAVQGLNDDAGATRWREVLALGGAQAQALYADGQCAVAQYRNCRYAGAWLDDGAWRTLRAGAAASAGLATADLPAGLRISHAGKLAYAFNFSSVALGWTPAEAATCLLGQATLAPLQMSIWRLEA